MIVPAVLIALLTVGVNTFGDAVARVSIGASGRRSELALAAPRSAASATPTSLSAVGALGGDGEPW